jgi:hypothetical protein
MSITLFQFEERRSKLQVFADKYQTGLSIAATFFFFSDIPDYLHVSGMIPINPLGWICLFAILALPFFGKIRTIPKSLILWIGFYTLISVLSLATTSSDEASMKEFRMRMLSVAFFVLMYAIYQQKSLKYIKYTIIAVVLMSIGNNFFELIIPKFFSELNTGRPAGFYINPNKAGCSLVLGLIFTIDVIKKPYRWLYALLIFTGIAATFSRGAILGWIICVLFLTIARVLSDRRRTVVAAIFTLVVMLALANPVKMVADYFGGSDSASWDVLDRLEQFQNPSLNDDSAMERKAVVGYAWLMFGNHPFWGNGLASTHKWTVSEVSTHNMYLLHLADHGIIGILFLPGMLFALVWRNRGGPIVQLVCFVSFVSLWGVFSHDIMEEKYILSTFALLAAMNTSEKWYLKYSTGNFRMAQAPPNGKLILPPAREPSVTGFISNQRRLPPGRAALPPARSQGLLPPSRR